MTTKSIISASYKTDIPAFYSKWFMNRLRAGYCKVINPFNRKVSVVSLLPDDVSGIVFWTKNVGPLHKHFSEIQDIGIPWIIQYAINNYPRSLELSVPDYKLAIRHVSRIVKKYGVGSIVWRYDPIIITSEATRDYHKANFSSLCYRLQGMIDEVIISFAQLYKKTRQNLEKNSKRYSFTWQDESETIKKDLINDLLEIAKAQSISLSICGQRSLLIPGTTDAKCIDPQRISNISGKAVKSPEKSHRAGCACHLSKDVGDYNTCPHGCCFCYAVASRAAAKENYKRHDPQDEFLIRPKWLAESRDIPVEERQLQLF